MNSDPDKDPGGPVPLARASLSDVTGIRLGHHLSSPVGGPQMSDPTGHLRGHMGLPEPSMHFPFHLTALGSSVYPPAFLGQNFNPAALLSSLSGRGDQTSRGRHSISPSFFPPGGTALQNLQNFHAALAAGDASRHNEFLTLLRETRNQDILFAFSKWSTKLGGGVPVSTSSSSDYSLPSPSTSSSYISPQQSSPPPKHIQEASPPENHSSRASSLSPSSYMTPRSLNSSPSTPSSGATSNYGSRFMTQNLTLENLSPTSPPSGGEGPNNNSSGSTPTRKSSTATTPRPDRVFTCKICNRSFGYKHVLQNHERTHTGEKPFECKECHKRFTRDHHLKTHMRLHTGEKPYHCTHCDRQFVQVANLRRHLRVHTGEKPYCCEICSNKFSDSNQLKAHLLIHKGEKPFSCNRCLGRFRRRHHLIHHKCSNDIEGGEKGLLESFSVGNPPYSEGNENYNYVDGYYNAVEEEMLDEETSPTATTDDEHLHSEKRRERKNKEPRRVVPNFPPELTTPPSADTIISTHLPPTPLPEQTEPEDLSISSRRNNQATYRANIALTTSSKYQGYPIVYPSPTRNTIDEDTRVISNRFEGNGVVKIESNL